MRVPIWTVIHTQAVKEDDFFGLLIAMAGAKGHHPTKTPWVEDDQESSSCESVSFSSDGVRPKDYFP